MAAEAAHDLDLIEPFDEFFINGERIISATAALGEAEPRKNYFFASWFDLEGGEYIIRVAAVHGSTWFTSSVSRNGRLFFNTPRDAEPFFATINLPRGRQRFDVIVPNLAQVDDSAWFAFSLWRQDKLVYASDASSWVVSDGFPLDEDLPEAPDPVTLLPVFSVPPNWANGIIERISYTTEILASESDTEQRRSLRYKMRRSFELPFARHGAIRSRIDSFLGGTGKNKTLVPMWHEQFSLSEPLGLTLTIGETLEMREFRPGGYVLAIERNPAVYELLKIESVDFEEGTISFEAEPSGTWGLGAKIVPLRIGRVIDATSIANVTDNAGTSTIRFEIDDSESKWFEPSWGRFSRTWAMPIDYGSAVTITNDRVTGFVSDFGHGPLEVHDQDQKSRLGVSFAMTLRGMANVLAFRKFIEKTRGRAVGFWIPTYTSDVQPVSSVGGSTIDIHSIGFAQFFKTDQNFRLRLIAEYRDGRQAMIADIDSVEEISPTVERIVLNGSLPSAASNLVKRISFMMYARFDQDTFELLHLVDQGRAVKTSIVARSTDIPEFDRVLSSLLYPIEAIEHMDVASDLSEIWMQDPVDHLDVSSSLVSGTLTATIEYETVPADAESLDVTSDLLDAVLTTVIEYEEFSADHEAIDVSSDLVSGTLTVAINYVTHVDPADDEAIDVSSDLVSGSLT